LGEIAFIVVSEESFVGIVGTVTLVIELNVVPIDQMSNFFINCEVTSVGVSDGSGEVGGLRSVGDDVFTDGKVSSEFLGNFD
jgi:hypothetical protein